MSTGQKNDELSLKEHLSKEQPNSRISDPRIKEEDF